MADTTIRLNDPALAGVTNLYIKIENDAGQIWNGTAMVAYVLADLDTYARPFPETVAGSGRFSFDFAALGLPADDYEWTICGKAGGSAAITDTVYGYGAATWDGSAFGTPVDLTPVTAAVAAVDTKLGTPAGASVSADIAGIASSSESVPIVNVVVDDAAPTVNSFVIAMADGSDVPETFVWRGAVACFSEAGPLNGGKYPIATYTRLTTTTARLTFSPALPVAPEDDEAIQVL